MNAAIAAFLFIFLFVANGSAMYQPAFPEEIKVEQDRNTPDRNDISDARADNRETLAVETDLGSNGRNSTSDSLKASTIGTGITDRSSSAFSESPQTLDAAKHQLEETYANYQKVSESSKQIQATQKHNSASFRSSTNKTRRTLLTQLEESEKATAVEIAKEQYKKSLLILNELEREASLPLTLDRTELLEAPILSSPTLHTRLNLPTSMADYGSTTLAARSPADPKVVSPLEHESLIRSSAATSSRSPWKKWMLDNRYDPLHPAKAIPTIIADTVVSALLVHVFFKIQPVRSFAAWFAGNVIASIIASPYFRQAIESRFPQAKVFFTSNDYWDPVYFAYYGPAWSIMGTANKNVFDVPFYQVPPYMLVSGALRQQVHSFIKKETTLLWNNKTINTLTDKPRNQTIRALSEYTRDVLGASARSGVSNVWPYLYHHVYEHYFRGNTTALETIVPSTSKSTVIYIGGLFGYYLGHRIFEGLLHPCYREEAAMAQNDLQNLYSTIEKIAKGTLTVSSDHVTSTLAGERDSLLKAATLLNDPHSNDSHSNDSQISKKEFNSAFNVLNSHLISLVKDPLLFRYDLQELMGCYKSPENISQAYRTIDLLEAYKGHVTAPAINESAIQQASKEFIEAFKKINGRDIENLSSNPDALDYLLSQYSDPNLTYSNLAQKIINDLRACCLKISYPNQTSNRSQYRALAGEEVDTDHPFTQLELGSLNRQPSSSDLIMDSNVSSQDKAATHKSDNGSSNPWFIYQN